TVQAWQGLLDLVRPALVICDHSPTLCLAAYGALPVVLVGDAFALPPADRPTFPALIPGRSPVVPEEQLLAVVREGQRRRGRPAPAGPVGRPAATALPRPPGADLERPVAGPPGRRLLPDRPVHRNGRPRCAAPATRRPGVYRAVPGRGPRHPGQRAVGPLATD